MHETIIEYIQNEIVGDVRIETQADLFGEGILDSMGMMKLVRFIERQFQMQVPFEDMTLENFITVEKICNYIAIRS